MIGGGGIWVVRVVIVIIGMVIPEKQRKCSTKCRRGVDIERALFAAD